MNANIPRIKSHARSLHHSPFSFLFRVSFHAALLPALCSFLRYSIPSLFHRNGSNFNPRRIATPRATRFRVYDLMNATPHLPPSTAVPRFFPSVNLRRAPYYKLFCAAQFKSIARNLVPRSFVLSSHFKSGTSAGR